ncbi:hypothetical protein TRFO_22841 [Tritrichomonas foetus]|uniref:Ubiquitin-like domain-containing protein n=1 Tax=Tritrichomonas foetus TaxID=1144522 RepID=A0A1J4KFM1_9EUKA|nr:hypothetical protein TRFO_22841 [Tritrichomonas foetus]|eukprot:OHT08580.1 hypothetical protein TRFO_22841 [Tritrichomonas foetus]
MFAPERAWSLPKSRRSVNRSISLNDISLRDEDQAQPTIKLILVTNFLSRNNFHADDGFPSEEETEIEVKLADTPMVLSDNLKNESYRYVCNGKLLAPALSFGFQQIKNGDRIFLCPASRSPLSPLSPELQSIDNGPKPPNSNNLSTNTNTDSIPSGLNNSNDNLSNGLNSNNGLNNNSNRFNIMNGNNSYENARRQMLVNKLRARFDQNWAQRYNDPESVFDIIRSSSDPRTAAESARLADLYRMRVEELSNSSYRKIQDRYNRQNESCPSRLNRLKTILPDKATEPSSEILPELWINPSSTNIQPFTSPV